MLPTSLPTGLVAGPRGCPAPKLPAFVGSKISNTATAGAAGGPLLQLLCYPRGSVRSQIQVPVGLRGVVGPLQAQFKHTSLHLGPCRLTSPSGASEPQSEGKASQRWGGRRGSGSRHSPAGVRRWDC